MEINDICGQLTNRRSATEQAACGEGVSRARQASSWWAALLDLLSDLRERQRLAYLFRSHDLAVVNRVDERIAVVYLGRIVEIGPTDVLFASATHPYSRALLSAIARPDPVYERSRERIVLRGEVPNPADPPSGCRFRTRCPTFAVLASDEARRQCVEEQPRLIDRGHGLSSACHHPHVP